MLLKLKYDFDFKLYQIVTIVVIFIVLYLTSFYSYLLFHSLVEIFSVVVASAIFMTAWNGRKFLENGYLMFLGIAYLFVALLDMLHLLAYKGMGVFIGYGSDLPTQMWIIARFVESSSLLFATIFLTRKLHRSLTFIGFLISISFLLSSVFLFKIFPNCFVEGEGLTLFKQLAEVFISFIFLAAIGVLIIYKKEFNKKVLQLLILSIAFSIAAEFAFMFYLDVYGPSNLLGHYLKVVSFFLIYKTIIETSFKEPYELLFKNLNDKTKRISEQKEMLEGANITKDKFFSIIAHDLRSPFNALLSSSNMLANDYDSLSEDEKKDLSGSIHNSAKKLYNLLSNLLQWSRAQLGNVEFKPSINDIYYIVLSEIALMTPFAEEKNIKLVCKVKENTTAFFDENMIPTVVRNLISNSIKFSNPGGKVIIDTVERDGKLEFSVQDNGVGIEEEDILKLFRIDIKFVSIGTAGEEGTGLGLILCKEFINKNNGVIRVESKIGKGSKFIIILPKKENK